MVPCDGTATSERWCCGDSNNCCTSNLGVIQLAQVLGGTLSSIESSATRSSTMATSLASSNAAATGSSTPASASASTPTSTGAGSGSNSSFSSSSNTGSRLSGGAIAGVVIGALAGVALLAAAIFFARRAAMWKRKASAAPEIGGVPPYTQHGNGYGPTTGYDASINDKHAHAHQGELYGSATTHELPGRALDSEMPATAPT
jgi:hypothetical protein